MNRHVATGTLVVAFCLVYLPDIGHGFIKDDFMWIATSRFSSLESPLHLFRQNVGFYRPVVSLTFGVDYLVWGLNPIGYALTNLAILVIDAVLLFVLGRRLGLARPAAMVAAWVWVFNFHAVNMALLWISGRTALLLAMFALLTTFAVLARRPVAAACTCLLALLCKEEAVVLPALSMAVLALLDYFEAKPVSLVSLLRATAGQWAAAGVYLLLRISSGAFGPTTAPSYYRFTHDPLLIARNIAEYADRSTTVAAVASLVIVLTARLRPHFNGAERRALAFAALWLVGLFALTVFLPVRSDLYALAPSIGTSLAAAAVAAAIHRLASDRFRISCTVLVILSIVLIPVYRARNQRWVENADLSALTLDTLQLYAADHQDGGSIRLVDDPSTRANLTSAFGSLLPEAVRLSLRGNWSAEVTTRADELSGSPTIELVYRNGRLAPPEYVR